MYDHTELFCIRGVKWKLNLLCICLPTNVFYGKKDVFHLIWVEDARGSYFFSMSYHPFVYNVKYLDKETDNLTLYIFLIAGLRVWNLSWSDSGN